MIGRILTVDVIGLNRKWVNGMQKHRHSWDALPSLFSFALFSLSPSLFCACQAGDALEVDTK